MNSGRKLNPSHDLLTAEDEIAKDMTQTLSENLIYLPAFFYFTRKQNRKLSLHPACCIVVILLTKMQAGTANTPVKFAVFST